MRGSIFQIERETKKLRELCTGVWLWVSQFLGLDLLTVEGDL